MLNPYLPGEHSFKQHWGSRPNSLICVGSSALFALVVALILAQNVFSAGIGSTVYEELKGDKLWYMKQYGSFAFDRGVFWNLKQVYDGEKLGKDHQVIEHIPSENGDSETSPERGKASFLARLCDNEYYSCC